MKLGIIGPAGSVSEACGVIEAIRTPVELFPLPYSVYTDVVDILNKEQKHVDAILFTGEIPYRYAVRYVREECPWSFTPKDELSLVFTLLKAGYIKHYNITKVCVDNIMPQMIYGAYRQLGYESNQVQVIFAPCSLYSPDYIENLLEFHQMQLKSGQACCSITGIESVCEHLQKEGLPCLMNSKAFDSIIKEFNRIWLNYTMHQSSVHEIVVIAVNIVYLENHVIYDQSVIQLLHIQNEVQEKIYAYAQSIDAAVFRKDEHLFYLCFLNIENKMHNQPNVWILIDEITKIELVCQVYIGIGITNSANKAQYFSDLGRRYARTYGTSCAYVVNDTDKVVGPLTLSHKIASFNTTKDYSVIAERCKVSVGVICKIDTIMRRNGLEYITPTKLAKLYGGNERNLLRILNKLEKAGYVRIIGKEQRSMPGRPGRLIQFNFGLE